MESASQSGGPNSIFLKSQTHAILPQAWVLAEHMFILRELLRRAGVPEVLVGVLSKGGAVRLGVWRK